MAWDHALRIDRPIFSQTGTQAFDLALRRKVFAQNGHSVIGATNGDEALHALRQLPVCAVIAYHLLQGTTGAELAKKMKKVKPEVPILLFSGNNPETLNGVDVYINKGEPTAKFLSILEQVTERFCSEHPRQQVSAKITSIPSLTEPVRHSVLIHPRRCNRIGSVRSQHPVGLCDRRL